MRWRELSGAPFDPPATVAQVLELRRAGQLRRAAGLGRRRLGEIDAALVLSGLALADPAGPRHRSPAVVAAHHDRATVGKADLQ